MNDTISQSDYHAINATAAGLARSRAGRFALVEWSCLVARAMLPHVETARLSRCAATIAMVEHFLRADGVILDDLLAASKETPCTGRTSLAAAAAGATHRLAVIAYSAGGGISEGEQWGSGDDLERYSVDALVMELALSVRVSGAENAYALLERIPGLAGEISRLGVDVEPAPGWENRAVERARREGVIGS